jgi:hypothetical protein
MTVPLQIHANGNDYNDGLVYELQPGFSFGTAAKTPEALRLEAGGGAVMPDAWEDAAWVLTWKVYGATGGQVQDRIRALLADFAPWTEVSVQLPAMPVAHVMFLTSLDAPSNFALQPALPGGLPFALFTLTGTRYGLWLDAGLHSPVLASDGTTPVTNIAVAFPGTVNCIASKGTTYGFVTATLTADSAPAAALALGFRPTPPSGYQPWQKYSGVSVAGAYGGVASKITTLVSSGFTKPPMAATEIDSVGYAGQVLALLRACTDSTLAANPVFYQALVESHSSAFTSNPMDAVGDSVPAGQYGSIFELAQLGVLPLPADLMPKAGGTFTSHVGVQAEGTLASANAAWVDTVVWMPAALCEVVTAAFAANGYGFTVENLSPIASQRRAYLSKFTSGVPVLGPTLSRTPYGSGLWCPNGTFAAVTMVDSRATTPCATGRLTLQYRPLYCDLLGSS